MHIDEFGYKTPMNMSSYIEVIRVNEKIIGFLSACMHDPYHEFKGDLVYILTINILEEYRKKGYGSKLLNNVMRYYQKSVLLDSYSKTNGFYEKIGYKKVSMIKDQTRYLKEYKFEIIK